VELVLTPFKDVVEKGRVAANNAGDSQPMLKAALALVKEGERALKRIEPLCKKHLDEYGSGFVDALKENGKGQPTDVDATCTLRDQSRGQVTNSTNRRPQQLPHGAYRPPLGV